MHQFQTGLTLEEVDPSLHTHLIETAREGHIRSARILMADAATLISHGVALPEPLASYISKALFVSALKNPENGAEPIEEAFNLKRKRGKNRFEEFYRYHLICMEVQLQYLKCRRYSSSRSGTGAYEAVANMYDYRSIESVENIFKKSHRRWNVKDKTAEELEALLPIYREDFGKHNERG